MEIDLSKQDLQDGQLLVVYIMLRTFNDINMYSIVLFYMILESYLYENGQEEIYLNGKDIANYLNLSIEEYEKYIEKLIEYGWFTRDEDNLIHVNYNMIYKLNQEIVSEDKENKYEDLNVRAIINKNKRDGVKMLLDRYWEC